MRARLGVSLLGLALAWPGLAHGQEAGQSDPGEEEVELPPPALSRIAFDDEGDAPRHGKPPAITNPYDAQGLRRGAFILFPMLEIGGVLSSNPAQVHSGRNADTGLRLKPLLRLESDWSRHQLTASASADLLHYLESEELASTAGAVQSALRLDVRHTTKLELEAGYALTSTAPSDSEVPNSARENRLSHAFSAGAALRQDLGEMELRLRTGAIREIFENVALSGGGVEDNGDRDYTELALSLRGTMSRNAILQPFAEIAYTPRFHDKRLDRNGLRRNFHGFSAALGLRIDDDPIWSGEVAATYEIRNYEDDSLDTERLPGLLANLQWRPTELTRVDLTAATRLAETSSTTDGARATWEAGIKVTQAVRENLDLFAGLDLALDDASTGTDVTLAGRSGLEWKLNPYLAWNAAYEVTWFASAAPASDYDEHRLIASLILKR